MPTAKRRVPWLGLLLLAPLFAFWGWDLYHSATKTGLYVTHYQGAVVKLRPTFKQLVELVDGTRSSSDASDAFNRGRYKAVLTGDDGSSFEVGLSRRDFTRATVPGYLVCRGGVVEVFASRAAAEAAGAVSPLP